MHAAAKITRKSQQFILTLNFKANFKNSSQIFFFAAGVSSEPEIQVNILYSASFSIFPYMCSSLLSINVCEQHCTNIENRYQTIHLVIAYKRLKTQFKIVKMSSP